MQHSTDRIRTTHVGSLPRPPALLDLMKAAAQGRQVDPPNSPRPNVAPSRTWSRDSARPGWTWSPTASRPSRGSSPTSGERLSGFEPRPGRDPLEAFRAEVESFPEYYEQYFAGAMTGGMAAPVIPLGLHRAGVVHRADRLRRDLDLLRAAAGHPGPGSGLRLRGGAQRGGRQ